MKFLNYGTCTLQKVLTNATCNMKALALLVKKSVCQLHRSVGHDGHANCEEFPICDDRITENDRCVIKIIGIH